MCLHSVKRVSGETVHRMTLGSKLDKSVKLDSVGIYSCRCYSSKVNRKVFILSSKELAELIQILIQIGNRQILIIPYAYFRYSVIA